MFSRMAVVWLLLQAFASADQQELERRFAEAQVQMLSGDYVAARHNFASVWKEFAATLGESGLFTIEARIFYGQVLTITGQPDEALTILGPISSGKPRTAMIARGSFALALRQSGQLDRAIGILKELVRIFPRTEPSDLVHLGRMHAELAVCQAYRHQFKEAEAHAFESLKFIDAGGNPIAANRASAYIVLGQIYLLADRDADALKVLRKAQREGKPFWQSSHPELAILDGALGVLAYRARHYDEAEFHTRRALESMEKLLGADHPEVATVARQLASVLKKQKRKDEARDLDARASRILDRRQIDPRVSAWSWRVPK